MSGVGLDGLSPPSRASRDLKPDQLKKDMYLNRNWGVAENYASHKRRLTNT
jgi:hypothetical protein